MRILLQFPEGLKQSALAEAEKLEAQGHEVLLSASACYGACDLALDEARHVKADKIVHFGHAEFSKVKGQGLKVEYVPYYADLDWNAAEKMLKKASEMLKGQGAKKIALVFPIQHLKNSVRVKETLKKMGFEVLLSKGGAHTREEGQVLGCDGTAAISGKAADADVIVYFGGGKFHPTGISSGKPVLCADPHLGDAYWITEEIKRQERKRAGSLLAASQAKSFGILVSTKFGQMNIAGARIAKKMIESKGRRAQILVANEFSPVALANFMKFDAYVNTACPRIGDDVELFGKPIANVADLKRLLELMV
jgi:2-(3-amino-3-carboxypropyl)histidine synthase